MDKTHVRKPAPEGAHHQGFIVHLSPRGELKLSECALLVNLWPLFTLLWLNHLADCYIWRLIPQLCNHVRGEAAEHVRRLTFGLPVGAKRHCKAVVTDAMVFPPRCITRRVSRLASLW
jgi:hypothetical protein